MTRFRIAPGDRHDAARPRRRYSSTNRAAHALGALIIASATLTLAATVPEGRAQAIPRSIDIAAPGPLGAVSVIGDSILLGSALWGPTLPDRLAERGWGPIKFRAGEGYRTHGAGEPASTYWIRQWRSQGWDAPNVIVNIGANDSGVCLASRSCALERIQTLVDEIGSGHTIWWPKISLHGSNFAYQETWNAALQHFADSRTDFHTWDWPPELAPYLLADGTHLSPEGYRTRSILMADGFTAAAARGSQRLADVPLPIPDRPPSSFLALPAQRVVDSRRDGSGRRTDGDTLRIDFGDDIPDDTTAVALYVAAAAVSAPGYFAVGPCGETTTGSTVNFAVGPAVGAPTIVALGTDGDVCVTSRGEAEIVVDLQGAFLPRITDSLSLQALAEPERLLDTRAMSDDDRHDELEISVPAGSSAVALNLTAVRPDGTGFLSAGPCDGKGDVANLNYRQGVTAAAFAIVNVSTSDTVCIQRSSSTDVIVDITGTFVPGPGLGFVPITPTRMLDTRDGTGGFAPIHGSGQTAEMRVAPRDARAVSGTLTIVKPFANSFVTAEACGPAIGTSSANAARNTIVANALTTAVTSSGRLCVTVAAAGHTLFDATGWWVDVE